MDAKLVLAAAVFALAPAVHAGDESPAKQDSEVTPAVHRGKPTAAKTLGRDGSGGGSSKGVGAKPPARAGSNRS
ncbi:MAG: hypothetical protein AAF790_11755, partial [Planctomycetota bacterium]